MKTNKMQIWPRGGERERPATTTTFLLAGCFSLDGPERARVPCCEGVVGGVECGKDVVGVARKKANEEETNL